MMAGFGKEMGHHLLNWSAWIFTVVVAILTLWWAKEHWWISVLIVLTLAGASLTFAYEKHHRSWKAAERYQEEMNASRAREEVAVERLREAERKLNEIPSTILLKLQSIIERHSFAELARRLITHAEFVDRMRRFTEAFPKPINLRTFTTRAEDLYVLAKAEAEALTHLRVGEPFLLVRRTANGLETLSARLVVHQPPDPGKEAVSFRIANILGEELSHIVSLAQSGDVEGIKGYRVRADCDLSRYESLDMRNLAVSIERLVQEIEPFQRGSQ